MNVYVASVWWRDSDPFVTVVGTTIKKVEAKVKRIMKEEAAEARDSGTHKSINAALDDLAWSGVHSDSLESITIASEREEIKEELDRVGTAYLAR